MERNSKFLTRMSLIALMVTSGLTPLYAGAILGSKDNPRLVPEGFSTRPTTQQVVSPGDSPSFVSEDGQDEIRAEREGEELGRLGQHYRTSDGKLWVLRVSESKSGNNRENFFHFHPVEGTSGA
jgi:hypothetical protein